MDELAGEPVEAHAVTADEIRRRAMEREIGVVENELAGVDIKGPASQAGQTMAGAGAGAGVPVNCDSGTSL
jgi:hypothetical protein